VRSCGITVGEVADKDITTIEGLTALANLLKLWGQSGQTVSSTRGCTFFFKTPCAPYAT